MILEPKAWQQAEEEFHQVIKRGYREEEVTQFIFFSLIVKELRVQNALLFRIAQLLEAPEEQSEHKTEQAEAASPFIGRHNN